MAARKIDNSITNTFKGNFSSFQPISVTGKQNTINAHLPQASPEIPLVSPTGDLKDLEKKLRQKIKALQLEADDEEYPEFELFRKKLTRFYQETTTPDVLADHLFQNKVLSQIQKDKIRKEEMDYDKNVLLYDLVLKKRGVFQLLPALTKSGNENVLKIIEDIVNEPCK